MAVPTKDSLLAPYSTNVNTRVVANYALYGLTLAQSSAYTAVHNPYIAALNAVLAARDAGTRSKSLTAVKDAAKAALLSYARQIYSQVKASTTVTEENKILLGIDPAKPREPIPVPDVKPDVDVLLVSGRIAKIKVHDSAPDAGRRFPKGVSAAGIFTFVGATPPTSASAYKFEGLTTRSIVDIELADSVASGSLVWISAAWSNPRGQFGPGSEPRSFTIQGGPAAAAA